MTPHAAADEVVDEVFAVLAAAPGAPGRRDGLHDTVTTAVRDQVGPGRHYHTPVHLLEMVVEVQRLVGVLPAHVAGAIAWHDVVYAATRGDNELQSAQRARSDLAAVMPPALVKRVAALVMTTVDHVADPDDKAGALLVDADLWILSAPSARYDEYAGQVRREYGHLSDDMWRRGRGQVLAGLRARLRQVGYLVGEVADRRDRTSRALANIARESGAL